MNSSFDLLIINQETGETSFPDWVFENTNEDGEADDQHIATYVKPLEKLIMTERYLRIICDDNGFNTETRIPKEFFTAVIQAMESQLKIEIGSR